MAASKLLDQQQKQPEEGPTPFSSDGWEEVDAECSSEVVESHDEDRKSFSVGSIEVCDVTFIMFSDFGWRVSD